MGSAHIMQQADSIAGSASLFAKCFGYANRVVDTKKTWAGGQVVLLSGGVILGYCSSPRMMIPYAALSVFVLILKNMPPHSRDFSRE